MDKKLGPGAKVRAKVFGAATATRCQRTPCVTARLDPMSRVQSHLLLLRFSLCCVGNGTF